jgi:hypothetical protein
MRLTTRNIVFALLTTLLTFFVLSVLAVFSVMISWLIPVIVISVIIISGVTMLIFKRGHIWALGMIIGGLGAFGTTWVAYTELMEALEFFLVKIWE